jgi:chemotaxis protein methyltransferase WspC
MTEIDFESLLKESMGLDSASIGSATIERAVQLRMATCGFEQPMDYWEKLRSSESELQELIEAVVVPETWFFRDAEAFSALVHLVTEEWQVNHPVDALRLLSGPCCSGEEPYSMVMALLDAGMSRDKIKVDAVDISVRALAQAKRGVYGSNSFRGENLGFRDRYFEQKPNGYCLAEWLRNIVTFHHRNLLAPDFHVGSSSYSVIFCRNVLIYFDHNTQVRVLETLKRQLCSDGFLFVGPAEAFLAARNGFKSVNKALSFAFRKDPGPYGGALIASRPRPRIAPKIPRKQRSRPAIGECPSPVSVQTPKDCIPVNLENAQRLADTGMLAEAGELCEAHLREQGQSWEAYYLLGLVRDGMGDGNHAEECYRKVLYLKPDHVETLMHLALSSERRGDPGAAKRLRERARRATGGAGR